MEPTTGYAALGDERIAYQIIGDRPVDLIVTAGWYSPFDIEWEEPSIRLHSGSPRVSEQNSW